MSDITEETRTFIRTKLDKLTSESDALHKLGQAIMVECDSDIILNSTAVGLLTVIRDRSLAINEELQELKEMAELAVNLG